MAEPRDILYVVRRPPDEALARIVAAQIAAGAAVGLLLAQDGVRAADLPPEATVAHLREDAEARGVAGPGEAIGYDGMVERIHGASAVIVW
jgi:hypothetical protein